MRRCKSVIPKHIHHARLRHNTPKKLWPLICTCCHLQTKIMHHPVILAELQDERSYTRAHTNTHTCTHTYTHARKNAHRQQNRTHASTQAPTQARTQARTCAHTHSLSQRERERERERRTHTTPLRACSLSQYNMDLWEHRPEGHRCWNQQLLAWMNRCSAGQSKTGLPR